MAEQPTELWVISFAHGHWWPSQPCLERLSDCSEVRPSQVSAVLHYRSQTRPDVHVMTREDGIWLWHLFPKTTCLW